MIAAPSNAISMQIPLPEELQRAAWLRARGDVYQGQNNAAFVPVDADKDASDDGLVGDDDDDVPDPGQDCIHL
ncbi:hypothetical protein V498_05427 [Pseudogymnoascus sp. VKM F-4517 (FW-2822)]|nr:hypothetical protein V498_05427 [Pseudogymnoascus sp. VKM F-4517 (FW-2822)]